MLEQLPPTFLLCLQSHAQCSGRILGVLDASHGVAAVVIRAASGVWGLTGLSFALASLFLQAPESAYISNGKRERNLIFSTSQILRRNEIFGTKMNASAGAAAGSTAGIASATATGLALAEGAAMAKPEMADRQRMMVLNCMVAVAGDLIRTRKDGELD